MGESAVIPKSGPKKALIPRETKAGQCRARPQAPAASELHAWAKVTEVLANIPRIFLPCASLDPAAPSRPGETEWEGRRRPHWSWPQGPSRASPSTQQGPPLPTRLPAKLCKHSSSSGRAGDREGRDKGSPPSPGCGQMCPDSSGLPSSVPPPPSRSVRATGLEAFLRHPVVPRSASPLQRPVLFLFSFCLEQPGFALLLLSLRDGVTKAADSQMASAM